MERRRCSYKGERQDQELTSECVLTTPSRILSHKHCSFKHAQDRHVHRRAWNCKSTCSAVNPKKPLSQAIWPAFVCAHARSYVFMTYENVVGSLETPSCFSNKQTRDELARTRNLLKFLDSSHDQGDERFTDAEAHSGLGRARNMKVCVVVSKSRLRKHILLFNSWPSRCLRVPVSLLPLFHPTSTRHSARRNEAKLKKKVRLIAYYTDIDVSHSHKPVMCVAVSKTDISLARQRARKHASVGLFVCVSRVRTEVHTSPCLVLFILFSVRHSKMFLGSERVGTSSLT
jgi:hypothetical protein